MKIISTLVLALICITGFSQDIPAKAYLTFEDGVVIPDGLTGVSVADGTAEITLNDGVTKFDAVPNALVTDETKNVYFMDFDGYIKFDETILNKTNFSLAMDYKWSENSVWYTGILSIVGYDSDLETPAWQSKQLLWKNPGAGQFNGFGITQNSIVRKDVYSHIVLTYNEGVLKLYVDGVKIGESSAQTIHTMTNVSLYLGTKLKVVDGTTGDLTPQLTTDGKNKTRNTKKYVDNVALFETTLSDADVLAIYDGTKGVAADVDSDMTVSTNAYPNPVKDQLFIDTEENLSVEMYNIGGVKVLEVSDVTNGVDVSGLTKGVYMLKCISSKGNVISTQKVIKK